MRCQSKIVPPPILRNQEIDDNLTRKANYTTHNYCVGCQQKLTKEIEPIRT